MIAYKFLRSDHTGVFTRFRWPLPGGAPWAWAEAPVVPCRSGIHACRVADLPPVSPCVASKCNSSSPSSQRARSTSSSRATTPTPTGPSPASSFTRQPRRCDATRRAAHPQLDHELRPKSLSVHPFRGGVLGGSVVDHLALQGPLSYRPGSADIAIQAWIRNQDPDALGRALHDRFTERHAAGALIAPEASAAALIRRLDGDATGEIWDVADDTASRSGSTQGPITRLHPGDTFPLLTITPADGQPLELPGAIGRLVPEDVIGPIKYVREHEAEEQAA